MSINLLQVFYNSKMSILYMESQHTIVKHMCKNLKHKHNNAAAPMYSSKSSIAL